jgi:dipeptidase
MHAGPVGVTAASMVVELAKTRDAPRVAWVSFCNPCVAPYLPVFLDASPPPDFLRAGRTAEPGSAWWKFKTLLTAVETDFGRHARRVRDSWSGFERELEAETDKATRAAAAEGGAARRATLDRVMSESWAETERRLDALLAAIS